LLLAAQLPPPHGLSKAAIYISTESALPTTRLSQMISTHPKLSPTDVQPTLDRVISIVTPDLESQDHILRYQLPVAIRRHNIGLVVLDSVAANYRAEFERPGANRNGANMAKRSI
jgi:DNA repair protein RAD57